MIAPEPISTASPLAGGVLGIPLTTVQFVAVSHAMLVVPVQRTVPAERASVTNVTANRNRAKHSINNFFFGVFKRNTGLLA